LEQIEAVLTVYHDGRFFVAVIEARSEAGCRAARRVFAVEPTGPELLELICREYALWKFSAAVAADGSLTPRAENPKRRQREAGRIQRQTGPSTRAQAALAAQREKQGRAAQQHSAQQKRERQQEQYDLRTHKRKEKHRGH